MNRRDGLTLIDVVIYSALTALLVAAFIPSAYQVLDSRIRVQRQIELTENKKFLLEKVRWVLQSNQAINSPAKGASGSSLSVNKLNFGSNPLVIDSLNNKARISSAGGAAVDITNSWADVVNLILTHQDLSGRSVIRVQATIQNSLGSLSVDTTIPTN